MLRLSVKDICLLVVKRAHVSAAFFLFLLANFSPVHAYNTVWEFSTFQANGKRCLIETVIEKSKHFSGGTVGLNYLESNPTQLYFVMTLLKNRKTPIFSEKSQAGYLRVDGFDPAYSVFNVGDAGLAKSVATLFPTKKLYKNFLAGSELEIFVDAVINKKISLKGTKLSSNKFLTCVMKFNGAQSLVESMSLSSTDINTWEATTFFGISTRLHGHCLLKNKYVQFEFHPKSKNNGVVVGNVIHLGFSRGIYELYDGKDPRIIFSIDGKRPSVTEIFEDPSEDGRYSILRFDKRFFVNMAKGKYLKIEYVRGKSTEISLNKSRKSIGHFLKCVDRNQFN